MTPALASICKSLGIILLPRNATRHPMETCAVMTLENILARYGEAHLTLVLRSIVETENNGRELVAPTIWAVSDLVRGHPSWPTSTVWLDALDGVDIPGIRELAKENRHVAKLRPAISTMLFLHLRQVFEPEIQGRLV